MYGIQFIPNMLSISRIPLSLLSIHLLQYERYFLIIGILTFVFISDILDGAIARRFDCVTILGKYLDKIGDVSAGICTVFIMIFFANWIFAVPYIPLVIELLYKSSTYQPYDMIEFTWMDILNSFLAHFFLPCTVIASFAIPALENVLPFLLFISCYVGVTCAIEAKKEWKSGPYSRGPYFGRLLW